MTEQYNNTIRGFLAYLQISKGPVFYRQLSFKGTHRKHFDKSRKEAQKH